MKTRLGAWLVAALMAGTTLTLVGGGAAPAHAAPAECHWQHRGEYNAQKICTDYRSRFPGSRVYADISIYEPPYTISPRYFINVMIKDTRKDGHCTWLAASKTDSPYPFTNVYQPGSKVCGVGESKVINLEFSGLPNFAPGLLKIRHCRDTDAGGKICRTFARQRIPYPSDGRATG